MAALLSNTKALDLIAYCQITRSNFFNFSLYFFVCYLKAALYKLLITPLYSPCSSLSLLFVSLYFVLFIFDCNRFIIFFYSPR
uniref:Ovule protein n=1 Tax=Panagrolaimus sp. PS1159 TaxID=55785 RepID=A0AC35FMV2_9BILA